MKTIYTLYIQNIMKNIVFVCIRNFQPYLIDAIYQVQKFNIPIYVLTECVFFENFKIFNNEITLINVNELDESYCFYDRTQLDKDFREGFWCSASLRFFYIYAFMKKYHVENVIHLENDVLIYHSPNNINFDNNYMYIPFDTFSRNIASILYIPNHDIFKHILDEYDFSKNDMENFSIIKNKIGYIRPLPIFPTCNLTLEHEFITNSYDECNGYIFDAAAMGQYLGGVDPQNSSIDSVGFVNETCIIKYNEYVFEWNESDGIRRPYLLVNNEKIPIFNLHIHSKNLTKFI